MQSLSDKLRKDTPSVDLTLKAAVPSEMVVSAASFPIFATVIVSNLSSANINVASIEMSVTKLKLCSFSLFRALRDRSYNVGLVRFPDEDSETWEDDGLVLNAVPESATARPNEKGMWLASV
jgi:hypothetical protein